jgi:hypothetical protein
LGAQNAKDRVVGEWTLQETLDLIKAVEKATMIQIIYPLIKITFKLKDNESEMPEPRFKLREHKLTIYSKSVKFHEISKHILYDLANLRKSLVASSISQISWSAISAHLKTRSSDDVRQYWNSKIMTILVPNQREWTDSEDILLLKFILA